MVHLAIGRGNTAMRVFPIRAHLRRPEHEDEQLGAQSRPGSEEASVSGGEHREKSILSHDVWPRRFPRKVGATRQGSPPPRDSLRIGSSAKAGLPTVARSHAMRAKV